MMESILQIIGLIVALCFIIFSFDDIIWDTAYLFSYKKLKARTKKVHLENFDKIPLKLLAIVVAAWHEDSVLEPVIENMLASVQYSKSMYHVFLGVYPNDTATIAVAQRLEMNHENVHVVINDLPGPTSKAQNINCIIKFIRNFENNHDWHFSSVTVHDSEDVVHPYEFSFTNVLIDRYDALQFPVFPLQRKPSFKNFFLGMTSGTYADEFAENHYRVMVMRDLMSAVVPSAGTGFAISHRILDVYENDPLFPEDSLTEDYKLSVSLAEKGFHVHYVLEKVKRLLDNDKVKWDYIATRSIFPATYKTAVRQKTRWIFGITMQSVKFKDVFKPSEINFAGRYTVYKDLKAKVGNLMQLPGYLIFIYFIVSLFVSIPLMYPIHTFSWWLCVILTVMMVYRQTMRAIAIGNIYGFRSVVVSCLLPPLMPIRLVWGNIINLSATIGAWRQLLFGVKQAKQAKETKNGKKVVWNKTDHEFLEKYILYRYCRNVGDVLLEKHYIASDTLKRILNQSRNDGSRIGDAILKNNAVTEEQLMTAVAVSKHKLFIKDISPFIGNAANDFDKKWLEQSLIYPIIKTKSGYVFAETNFTPPDVYEDFVGSEIKIVYTTKSEVMKAINGINTLEGDSEYRLIYELLEKDRISCEQAVLAISSQHLIPDILVYMGLKTGQKKVAS